MNYLKIFFFVALILFGSIFLVSLFTSKSSCKSENTIAVKSQEIVLDESSQPAVIPVKSILPSEKRSQTESTTEVDRIEEFFNQNDLKFPIVETITYKSRVPWQKGRPAWLSDYASHYKTSRHFIARSLNGSPDYFRQELKEGNSFNVLKMDKDFEFYLVVDTSSCKLRFYYVDNEEHSKVLIKSYTVTLGRIDSSKVSGLLTPLGCFTLGNRTAVFKPGAKGMYHGKQVEMITVFGTRWIPFEKEVGNCSEPAKGFGIHGTPWDRDSTGKLIDKSSEVGKYDSDGCLRLSTHDIEELYAIIITRPTTIEIVRNFDDAQWRNIEGE